MYSLSFERLKESIVVQLVLSDRYPAGLICWKVRTRKVSDRFARFLVRLDPVWRKLWAAGATSM